MEPPLDSVGCLFGYTKGGPKTLRAEGTGGRAESWMVQPGFGKVVFLVEHCKKSAFFNRVLLH